MDRCKFKRVPANILHDNTHTLSAAVARRSGAVSITFLNKNKMLYDFVWVCVILRLNYFERTAYETKRISIANALVTTAK